ncbi:MAG: nucleotidyltransferase domain-containing protein [Clostridia bacterium]|nr:nucleotidyltransferase domain-containing protein [Clostridia bacterium]
MSKKRKLLTTLSANTLGDNEAAVPEMELYLTQIRRIVLEGLRGQKARVYLFGSRACGKATGTSDVDVAVLPLEPLPPGTLSAVREALEESTVPYTVDLVDLSRADPAFRKRVVKEGVLWGDLRNA